MYVHPARILPYLDAAQARMPHSSILVIDAAAIRDFARDVAKRLGHDPVYYDLRGSVGKIRCRACGQITTCDSNELRVSGELVRERCSAGSTQDAVAKAS